MNTHNDQKASNASLRFMRSTILPGCFCVLALTIFLPALVVSRTQLDVQHVVIPGTNQTVYYQRKPIVFSRGDYDIYAFTSVFNKCKIYQDYEGAGSVSVSSVSDGVKINGLIFEYGTTEIYYDIRNNIAVPVATIDSSRYLSCSTDQSKVLKRLSSFTPVSLGTFNGIEDLEMSSVVGDKIEFVTSLIHSP